MTDDPTRDIANSEGEMPIEQVEKELAEAGITGVSFRMAGQMLKQIADRIAERNKAQTACAAMKTAATSLRDALYDIKEGCDTGKCSLDAAACQMADAAIDEFEALEDQK